MAEPVALTQANCVLVGSPEDKAAGTVLDLPIHRLQDLDGNWHVISCWTFTAEELAEIARTGRAWLHSWGKTHPPISIGGGNPFPSDPAG